MESWDCLIVGGGIAGLQAAIQLGRYEHRVLVIDSGNGRSTLCRQYHNVLGWPDGISGSELRRLGRMQAESLGVGFVRDEIVQAVSEDSQAASAASSHPGSGDSNGFLLSGKSGAIYRGKLLLLATGVMDRFPEWSGLKPCLGSTIYVCPDCDGYEIKDKPTMVLGAGDVGAEMALTLSVWTKQLVYVNHERKPVKLKTLSRLNEYGIGYEAEEVDEIRSEGDGQFRGVILRGGKWLQAERGFIAFGGNEVRSELARQLGVERLENRHVLTDPRSKMTNVPHVWVAGDVGVHAEQVTIAMGEGSQAAIWMHKAILQMQLEQAGKTVKQ
jgi:thioredoxin reductase (NADPH)